jgi:hypothetical protein
MTARSSFRGGDLLALTRNSDGQASAQPSLSRILPQYAAVTSVVFPSGNSGASTVVP